MNSKIAFEVFEGEKMTQRIQEVVNFPNAFVCPDFIKYRLSISLQNGCSKVFPLSFHLHLGVFWNEVSLARQLRCSCKRAEDLSDPTVFSRSYIETRKSL